MISQLARMLNFRLMALTFAVRDRVSPRSDVLKEAGLRAGLSVLDYGCGPGSYVVPAAESVGAAGKVFALDVDPRAIASAARRAEAQRLKNVETILSDCKTGLPDQSVDIVLLYDTLHKLASPPEVLEELHRVLKPKGILSVSDHHLNDAQITDILSADGLFGLMSRGAQTYTFLAR